MEEKTEQEIKKLLEEIKVLQEGLIKKKNIEMIKWLLFAVIILQITAFLFG